MIMRVVAIIQARAGSTRLPGKIFKPILGKPMLAHMLERVQKAKKLDTVVLATSDKPEDDATAALGAAAGVAVFRGSETDVLDRFYNAAKDAGAEAVVRLTGDCPMHSGAVVDEVVEHFLKSGADYCAGPADTPEGFDTEVFSFSSLERAALEAALPSEREHVTLYIRNHPELFTIAPVWKKGVINCSSMHFSVDTPQDFELAENIFAELGADFSKEQLLELVERRPELLEINKGGTGFEGLYKSIKEDEEWKLMQRMVLGTVELGMEYGIDGQARPAQGEAFAILDAALAAGIDTFDTASAYGNAEEILGEWIKTRNCADRVKIISKGSGRADIGQSLKRLGLKAVDGYLLHNSKGSFAELQEAKRNGLAKHIGASVYKPEEVRSEFEYVQVPYNALDRRFEKAQDTVVFVRSPFLQGLLLMNPADVPPHLASARPYVEAFQKIARQFGLSPLQAALLFVLHAHPTNLVVFGVKTLQQLSEIIEAAHTPLPNGYLVAVRALPVPPDTVTNPTLWKAQ